MIDASVNLMIYVPGCVFSLMLELRWPKLRKEIIRKKNTPLGHARFRDLVQPTYLSASAGAILEALRAGIIVHRIVAP